jgi:hypothetical protein
MQQPVTDGIGEGRVAEVRMPVTDGALAGDDGGCYLVAVFHDLQQVSLLYLRWSSEQEIVNNK